ncbi:MAG TPA: ABC transporter permease, partial [Gemmatimonadaceae bacterium]|nr:ABC transporter permease [Gemmatimonadaceae bacterium]
MMPNNEPTDARDAQVVPKKPAAEVDSELAFHLEQRVQANIARGMTPEDARRAALERFGDLSGVRAECTELLAADRRAEARRDWFGDLAQDVRFAVRGALRTPVFSVLVTVTLMLGIGANAAVFGTVKSVLLNPLPYADAGRLVRIFCPYRSQGVIRGALSAGTISDVRERQHSFESLAAFLPVRDAIYSADEPTIVKSMFVEPQLFRTLGVVPVRGTAFRDEDAEHDTTTAVMISYGAWQRFFGGSDETIGKTIRFNGIGRTIIGVLPRNFVPPENEVDFYQPLSTRLFMRDPIGVRGSHSFGFVGRLKPGVTVEGADRELNGIGAELEQLYAKDNLGIGLSAMSLRDAMVGDTRTPLLILLASAGLVLIIMCANLAGALLSRTMSRRKEFAVRVALGAGRERLVRQLLTESILYALAGGAAGLVLASLALRLVRTLAAASLPSYASLSLDVTAVIVMAAVALLAGLAFGVGPSLAAGRGDPQRTLRDESRGTSEGRRTRHARGVLVAGQIALCVSLLAGAALLGRSLWAIMNSPLGFQTHQLLTLSLQLPNAKYPTADSRVAVHDRIEEALHAVPGVQNVAFTSQLPTKVTNSNGLFIENAPWAPNQPVPFILTVRATDDYYKTLSIPVRQGRAFSTVDRGDAPPAIIINDAMAAKFWPKGDALGARVHIGPPNPNQPWFTVVGIVGNVRNDPTKLVPEPMMFLSQRQEPFGDNILIRTSGEPTALTAGVRKAIATVDPSLPMYNLAKLDDVVGT